jgi:hypothetical protein
MHSSSYRSLYGPNPLANLDPLNPSADPSLPLLLHQNSASSTAILVQCSSTASYCKRMPVDDRSGLAGWGSSSGPAAPAPAASCLLPVAAAAAAAAAAQSTTDSPETGDHRRLSLRLCHPIRQRHVRGFVAASSPRPNRGGAVPLCPRHGIASRPYWGDPPALLCRATASLLP